MPKPLKLIMFILALCAAPARAAPVCSDCNVVLISMDALQARHVSHLGYKLPTTKTVDSLARAGVSFAQAISPASWTVPTYLSVFSSTYPSVHGLTNRWEKFSEKEKKQNNFKLAKPGLITIAEVFKAAGYATGGFTGDAGVSAVIGYDKGFDVYTDEVQFGGMDNSEKHALAWLDKLGGKKFFLFFHGYDSHGQYAVKEGYRSRFHPEGITTKYKGTKEEQAEIREAGLRGEFPKLTEDDLKFWRGWYDGKIADADDRLGSFLSALEKRGLKEKTLFVLISDHGTEFAEHGAFDHGHTLYDELVHVPFVISGPGVKKGRVLKEQVTTLDVLPTVLELTGLPVSKELKSQMAGRSLAQVVTGGSLSGADVFTETDLRNFTHKRALRTSDGWKLILTLETGAEELYNLRKDPSEKNNLAEKETGRREKLRKKLMAHIEAMPLGRNSSTECLPVYQGQCVKK
jgi:choline-sulfatase